MEASKDDMQRARAAEIERRSMDASIERGEDWRVVLDEIRADVFEAGTVDCHSNERLAVDRPTLPSDPPTIIE